MTGCFLLAPSTGPKPGPGDEDIAGSLKAVEPLAGPVHGIVYDEAGKPAPGVKVAAYLDNSNPLAGNSGSGLAGNSGSGYRVAATYHAADLDAKTDAMGRFALSPTTAGTYNLEAVQSDDSKSWKAEVAFAGVGSKVDAGRMDLAPTGKISG